MKVSTLIKIYILVKNVGCAVIGVLLIKTLIIKKYMCNGCHDMSSKAIRLYNLCLGYNNGNAYSISFTFMSKNDALNLIKNAIIIDKKGIL